MGDLRPKNDSVVRKTQGASQHHYFIGGRYFQRAYGIMLHAVDHSEDRVPPGASRTLGIRGYDSMRVRRRPPIDLVVDTILQIGLGVPVCGNAIQGRSYARPRSRTKR